jgi:S-adenosylmethionine-diacylglycerol 3-amino-3-carboxypropyl transferase
MARDNPIQFAIVREDPRVELAVLDRHPASSGLLIASGGCTAFTLAALRPELKLTLLDANAAQLELVARKAEALRAHAPGTAGRLRAFGVGEDDPASFSGCGNFESLFRGLRGVLDEHVLPASERRRMIREGLPRAPLIESRYWPVAFALFFSDAMLEAMFGPDATQHAPRGSYPGYFQRAIERGLSRPDAATNPWLHQVLLGCWLPEALPEYLERAGDVRYAELHADLQAAPSFAQFSFVSLSNLFDWMSTERVRAVAERLSAECRPGTTLIIRQLNNTTPVEQLLASAFRHDLALSAEALATDRSLFYGRVLVLVKT